MSSWKSFEFFNFVAEGYIPTKIKPQRKISHVINYIRQFSAPSLKNPESAPGMISIFERPRLFFEQRFLAILYENNLNKIEKTLI